MRWLVVATLVVACESRVPRTPEPDRSWVGACEASCDCDLTTACDDLCSCDPECGCSTEPPDAGASPAPRPSVCDRACDRVYQVCGYALTHRGGAITEVECLAACDAGDLKGAEECLLLAACTPADFDACFGGEPPPPPRPPDCTHCLLQTDAKQERCRTSRSSCLDAADSMGVAPACYLSWGECSASAYDDEVICFLFCGDTDSADDSRCIAPCARSRGRCDARAEGDFEWCNNCLNAFGECNEVCRRNFARAAFGECVDRDQECRDACW